MKNRANIALVTAFMIAVLILASCGGGASVATTSSIPAVTTSTPAVTTSTPAVTTSTPASTTNAPTTSLANVTTTTTTSGTTTAGTATGAIIIKVTWGKPPLCTTHPLIGAFSKCYNCHIPGGVGALHQVDGSHSCDECHNPGPALDYYCTGGNPDPMPSCTMCHGPDRIYDGTKKADTM